MNTDQEIRSRNRFSKTKLLEIRRVARYLQNSSTAERPTDSRAQAAISGSPSPGCRSVSRPVDAWPPSCYLMISLEQPSDRPTAKLKRPSSCLSAPPQAVGRSVSRSHPGLSPSPSPSPGCRSAGQSVDACLSLPWLSVFGRSIPGAFS